MSKVWTQEILKHRVTEDAELVSGEQSDDVTVLAINRKWRPNRSQPETLRSPFLGVSSARSLLASDPVDFAYLNSESV
ncbi:hypothetical protein ACMFWY_20570 [Roseiconus sp. JC912]|uniref:hypothetical protein n=1 Tax=Roseiconus sp. JC912 TaxID=3396307 RepID=UPI003A4C6CA9